jgi:hypothetical protein
LRQQADQNPPAVERRDGNEIEYREHDIENERVFEIFRDKSGGHIGSVIDQVECRGRQRRQHEVDRRSCGRHKNRVAPRMTQRAKIHRHWLGVAEQEWRAGQ